jgi:hypothetical protein
MAQRYTIMGRDTRHVEAERDRWLLEHPEVVLVREYPPTPERSLLAKIGGKDVPRISIVVEYAYRQGS